MVLEDLLNKIGKRKILSFFLGILYVFVSYGTAQIFFPSNISITMIFFITLLLIPSTAKIISIEERIERRDGLHHFIRDHYVLMEIFLFLFLGIFIGYLIIGNYSPASISDQMKFLEAQGISLGNKVDKIPQFTGILLNNVSVILIAFVLSLFYGVGALFLIVRNASIFSSFIIKFSELAAEKMAINAAIFSIHFIPEVFGFLLAAIAGGVISKGMTREKFGSEGFRNVIKDGTTLLVISLLIIALAAFLEIFVTPGLIKLVL